MHELLSGAQATWAAEALRDDAKACQAAGFGTFSVPEEATIWRALGQLDAAGGWAIVSALAKNETCKD